MWFIIVFALLPCARTQETSLEGLLEDYCESGALADTIHGLAGPPGRDRPRGRCGYQGSKGSKGPPGFVDKTEIQDISEENLRAVFRTVKWTATYGVTLESCNDIKTKLSQLVALQSGVYEIYLPKFGWANVYCDMDVDGGGWTVFQRRTDGNTDFFRGWRQYDKGFGDRNGEFWLGLDKIRELTKNGVHDLRIDMIERNGQRYYAKYRKFCLGPGTDHYRLHVHGYSGNATDSLEKPLNSHAIHNQKEFSTKDADFDPDDDNCAESYKGAWWYDRRHHSNLNGEYGKVTYEGIRWRHQSSRSDLYMRFTEMKLR